MVQETWVQSQVVSYQRLLKWYLIPPCLTLSSIRYVSRVKWSNPEKGVAPSPTPQWGSYWKESLMVTLDYSCQLLKCPGLVGFEEGSYLPSNRNSPKSEWIENAPLAILTSTEQFNSMLVLGSSGENGLCFGAFFSSNWLSFLLRCGTRSNEWGTHWDLNSLMKVY